MHESNKSAELSGVEALLRNLQPDSGRVSADMLLYRAGQASVRRTRWLWPTTSLVLALGLGLGLSLWLRPARSTEYVLVERDRAARESPRVASTMPTAERPPERSTLASRVDDEALRLRELVLRFGVEAAPRPISRGAHFDSTVSQPTSMRDQRKLLEKAGF